MIHGNFNIDRIRAEKIKDLFILLENGYSIYHRAYVSSKMDEDLISGFISAIFALSKELSIDRIHVMDMQESRFIYGTRSPFIFILNVAKDVDLTFGKNILSQYIEFFESRYNGLDDITKSDYNLLHERFSSIDFDSKLDSFIKEEFLEQYFKFPSKILEVIESYIVSLFGSVGEEIINSAIKKVCKQKEHFKKSDIENVILLIEEYLARKINPDQVKRIIQQLKDVFISKTSKG